MQAGSRAGSVPSARAMRCSSQRARARSGTPRASATRRSTSKEQPQSWTAMRRAKEKYLRATLSTLPVRTIRAPTPSGRGSVPVSDAEGAGPMRARAWSRSM